MVLLCWTPHVRGRVSSTARIANSCCQHVLNQPISNWNYDLPGSSNFQTSSKSASKQSLAIHACHERNTLETFRQISILHEISALC